MTQATQDMLDALRQPNLGSAQVVLIMSEVRKQLESRPEWDKKFPTLRFYCDWCVHSQIDYNKHCKMLIRELNQCLWQLDEDGNYDANSLMNNDKFLRIPQLCNELGIVLSAMSGEIVYPSQTFIFALYNYLQGVPVIPVDTLRGALAKGQPAYVQLCQDLQIGPNRPLFKNLVFEEVKPNCLVYSVEMDDRPTIVQGEVYFPICTDPPFIFADDRKTEEQFVGLVNHAQELFITKQLDNASSVLQKASAIMPNVRGLEPKKAQMFHLIMEIEWARYGDIAVLPIGKEAMKYMANDIGRSNIYCQMGEYALQRIKIYPEALDKAQEYIQKSLELAAYNQFKVRPMRFLGEVMVAKELWDDAFDILNEAAQYADESHLEAEHALIRSDLAYVIEMKGQVQTALAEYTHAENIAKGSADPLVIAKCTIRKAQCLFRMEEIETARLCVNTLFPIVPK